MEEYGCVRMPWPCSAIIISLYLAGTPGRSCAVLLSEPNFPLQATILVSLKTACQTGLSALDGLFSALTCIIKRPLLIRKTCKMEVYALYFYL
ncbi:hypothetical protein B0H11DRAFT_1305073 [Mycena galericulata]|nr:hypothetical protein B0H11DRAFT_1305073 [Mycena galericulata]